MRDHDNLDVCDKIKNKILKPIEGVMYNFEEI